MKKQKVSMKSKAKSEFAPDKTSSRVTTDIPKNIKEELSAEIDILPGEKQARLTSENKLVVLKEPEQPPLEDYDHVNLREYEEGEVEPGDLEWTRYAVKKGPQLPDSKIDLNVIPDTENGLMDILTDLQQAEVYNIQGEAKLEKNHVEQAILDFSHALEINPNYVDALVNRGKAYVLKNQYKDALRDLNHALDFERKRAEIYNMRGDIYLQNKMYDLAIEDFATAISLQPVCSEAYINRAIAYTEIGMKEEAKSDFIQAMKTDSDKTCTIDNLTDLEALFDD
jgi:tetratricopeptide (TPR) repeat protein